MAKNFYEILEIEVNATPKEINDAYYRLALLGEDKNPDNLSEEDRARELLNAYETLRDIVKRSTYDKSIPSGDKLETNSTEDTSVDEYYFYRGGSTSDSSESYYSSTESQNSSTQSQNSSTESQDTNNKINTKSSNSSNNKKSKPPMEVVSKYYEFLTHTIKKFELVKNKLDVKSTDGKNYSDFLSKKIDFFNSIISTLDKLQKHGKDTNNYNKKYNEMKLDLETKMAEAWHTIYETTESNPDENKLKPDYRPQPSDFKKIADSTLDDWKDNFSLNKNNKAEKSIQPPQKETPMVALHSTLRKEPQKKSTKATLENTYEHKTTSNEQGRYHAFEVSADDFVTQNGKRLADKYRRQKGDYLKTEILNDFKKEIERATSKPELRMIVKTLKASQEYKVLETGQGTLTKLFNLETSSEKAFAQMIKDKIKQIKAETPKATQTKQEI